MHDILARRINAVQLLQPNDSSVEARVTINVTTLKYFSGYFSVDRVNWCPKIGSCGICRIQFLRRRKHCHVAGHIYIIRRVEDGQSLANHFAGSLRGVDVILTMQYTCRNQSVIQFVSRWQECAKSINIRASVFRKISPTAIPAFRKYRFTRERVKTRPILNGFQGHHICINFRHDRVTEYKIPRCK